MEQPLVSILTPFKNTSEFLSECLTSIQKQSYTNWELLIVDDGSTDNSYKIVNTFTKKDKRIKLFTNPGKGIIEALRFAYSKASGIFITRMDSDDIMTPNKLEVLTSLLLKNGKGYLATGLVKYFSKEGISAGYKNYETWLNKLTKAGTNYSEIYKECVIASPCWMLYRTDFKTIEAFKPNRYPEDYDLTFRCYKYGLKVIPCNELLHYWRDYSNRTSRTHKHYAQNYFLDIKLHYFLKLDHNPKKPLVIWGAGFKGKTIAKSLVDQNIPFYWICDNPNKIGRDIYGQTLLKFDYLKSLKHPQSIVTVANADAQVEIRDYMQQHEMKEMSDYFFFC